MAKSGQLKTNTTYDSYFWVKWEQSGNQDIANNLTFINWSVGVYCGHNFYSNAIRMSAVSINGSQVYGGGTYSNFSTGNHIIASGTMWINHTADGTKKFSISSFTGWLYSNNNYSTNGESYTLDPIPRQATLTSAPNFTDEGNPTISYTNPAGNSVASLNACIAIGGDILIPYRSMSKTGTSYTFNFTEAERKLLRQACTGKTLAVNFYVTTKIGDSTFYSIIGKTLSIVNGNPTFTESQISYEDINEAVTDITKNPLQIVQNHSKLAVTVEKNATANKEATISKYDITVNGVTKTITKIGTVDFGKINTASNTEIVVTVTDSRGNTTTVKKTVTVLAWALPVFTVSLERQNNYEDKTFLTVDASISSVNGKNTMKIWYEYAERDGIYSQPIEIANRTKYTLELDKNKAYDFNIVVEDAFDYSSNQYVVNKGKFPLFIDTQKNAVGINDFPAEGEALRVAEGVANFIDGVQIGGNNMPDFVVEQGVSGIWIYRKWASGIAECWGVTDAITQTTSTDWNVMTSNEATPAINYPFAFINPPVVSPSVHTHNLNFWLVTYTDGSTTITPSYQIARGKSESTITFKLGFYVFGQWKQFD